MCYIEKGYPALISYIDFLPWKGQMYVYSCTIIILEPGCFSSKFRQSPWHHSRSYPRVTRPLSISQERVPGNLMEPATMHVCSPEMGEFVIQECSWCSWYDVDLYLELYPYNYTVTVSVRCSERPLIESYCTVWLLGKPTITM